MTVTNGQYQDLFITINANIRIGEKWVYIGQQYKWLMKKRFEVDANCNCGTMEWRYLVEETARGEKLDAPVWISELYAVEEKTLRAPIERSVWLERRDDVEHTYDTSLPHHLRKPKPGITDDDGYLLNT